MSPSVWISRAQPWFWLLAGVMALLLARPVAAQDDPPGRVGRIAEMAGAVSWFDHERGEWVAAERNRPLTTGDRLSTAAGARVELRSGSTVMRLGGRTELELRRLDDERLVLQLHSGFLALRLRSREAAEETEVLTVETRMLPLRAGHYRFDRIDDTTLAGSWRGELAVEGGGGVIGNGQRLSIQRTGRGELRLAAEAFSDDAFAAWVSGDDERDDRTASLRHVSPEMTGAEELDRNGRWASHPEFGPIWYPQDVRGDWEPYRFGRWAWVRPWGWTWIDEAPWGFAPFHYGRWLQWQGRWGWVPGVYVPRPAYAPALVGWSGGVSVGVQLQRSRPPAAWVPLGPREAFRPWYRTSPAYVERIHGSPAWRGAYPQPMPQWRIDPAPRRPEPLRPEAWHRDLQRAERPALMPPAAAQPMPDRSVSEPPRSEAPRWRTLPADEPRQGRPRRDGDEAARPRRAPEPAVAANPAAPPQPAPRPAAPVAAPVAAPQAPAPERARQGEEHRARVPEWRMKEHEREHAR